MRKILGLIALVAIASMPSFAQASGVSFTWTGNGNATLANCSTTVTASCISGYTLSDVTNAASPVVISSTIAATALSYTLATLPSAGSRTYNLVVNAKDENGNAVASSPAIAVVAVPFVLNAPTGFTATP